MPARNKSRLEPAAAEQHDPCPTTVTLETRNQKADVIPPAEAPQPPKTATKVGRGQRKDEEQEDTGEHEDGDHQEGEKLGWKMVSNGSRASTVADICAANGLPYVHGCGCYELSAKGEKLSADKQLVARNKSTGEILVGTVDVRKRLGLPLGEAKLVASHVPAPWTLFINSTSPNRTIPPQGNVLIRVEGLPPKKTTKKAGKRRRTGDDDEEGDEEDEDGDEGEESAPEGDDYPEHKKLATRNAATARKNFFNQTLPFQVKGKSGKVFYCRGAQHCRIDLYDGNWEWPRAYVGGDSQPVTGAVWGVEGKRLFLVAIFSISLTAEECGMYYVLKGPFADEEQATHMINLFFDEDVVPSDVCRAFSVSSGEDEVKRFDCPALEAGVTLEMLCPSGMKEVNQ